MKRSNPFPALLRLRSIEERRRRAELGAVRASYDEARARLATLVNRPTEDASGQGVLSAAQLRSLRLRGLAAHQQLVAAMSEEDRRRRQLDDASETWRSAASDLDAAERLEERNRKEAALHARRAAEQALADLHLMMNHQRGGPS